MWFLFRAFKIPEDCTNGIADIGKEEGYKLYIDLGYDEIKVKFMEEFE